MKKHKIDLARQAASHALFAIWKSGRLLEDQGFKALEASDRARALRLTRESLRYEAAFDAVIAQYASNEPKPAIRAIMHVALYELLIDKLPAYAAINSAVDIAKAEPPTRKAAGFLNAVLRKAARYDGDFLATNSFGKPLRSALSKHYPEERLDAINLAQGQTSPVDLRLKQGEDLAVWAEQLEAQALPDFHALRLPSGAKISELTGFEAGKWWVQDIAATLAVDCFTELAGKTALDLCAAPGGKTMQLADAGAKVTAVELSKKRAERIRENLSRVKLEAELVIKDALQFDKTGFDCVLLDAPCSATGTLRRHPDLRFAKPLRRLKTLIPLQAKLLEHAFSLLKIGGELIYCTCSLLPEEGEAQIEQFLSKTPNARSIAISLTHADLKADKNGYMRSFPDILHDIGSMDGFFIAKLTKIA